MFHAKKPSKTNRWYFSLGILSFLVLLVGGIILVVDYPTYTKVIGEVLLIASYIFLFIWRVRYDKMNPVVEAAWVENRTSSFFLGLGFIFLLVIIVVISAMVLGILLSNSNP
jgi:Na+-transporting NADH:ubiquinone oxidoreductase subunit NqrB